MIHRRKKRISYIRKRYIFIKIWRPFISEHSAIVGIFIVDKNIFFKDKIIRYLTKEVKETRNNEILNCMIKNWNLIAKRIEDIYTDNYTDSIEYNSSENYLIKRLEKNNNLI